VARLGEIMGTTADDGGTLPAELATEHDGLSVQVKSIDGDLVRWRELEQMQIAAAVPVAPIVTKALPFARVSVKPNVPIGTAFVRLACATLHCHGNKHEAAEYATRWNDSTPEVALALKAAIAPGTTTDAAWAGPLVNQNIANEFLELLRPATILGKIPNLREVPLNTKVPAQTAGGTYGWVGEAKPKPVTKLAFATESLGVAKAAGIIILTEELVRLSNPKAEEICRKDMIAGIAQFLDQQFIDPAVAAVAGVNPAAITNGAPTAAASGAPLADILGLINHFATNNISVDGLVFILNAANALALSFRNNADGSPQFPGITVGGGSYKGMTFIASNAASTNVIALQPQLILFADDGGVTIDASREASLQMDSAPASPADATTVYVSLWQTNCVGLRAERFVNWKRVGTNSVKYLTAANWPAPSDVTGEPQAANGRTKNGH
jgi:HK97 family phage major capsid protein